MQNQQSSKSPYSPPKYKLVDWYPLNKLNYHFVSANQNAIYFLNLPENRGKIKNIMISKNPKAINFLSLPDNKKFISYYYLSSITDYKAIKLLIEGIKENRTDIDWKTLSANPAAIKILTSPTNYNYINWEGLSSNPSPKAIEFLLLERNIININWKALSSNPSDEAIKYLKENEIYIDWDALSTNTNPEAIKFIIYNIKKNLHINDINWNALSENPAIFIDKKDIEAQGNTLTRIFSSKISLSLQKRVSDLPTDLHENITNIFQNLSKNKLLQGIPEDKLIWSYLCKNTKAIDLLSLRKNYDKIDWLQLSKNPEAINLLRKRIDYENSLPISIYQKLPTKIDWLHLSENPEAIELLSDEFKKNPYSNKIFWSILSKNPKAIQLLEKRVKYEISLEQLDIDQLNSIYAPKRINWNSLSANSAIFVPM
jgi:hypothetical protein